MLIRHAADGRMYTCTGVHVQQVHVQMQFLFSQYSLYAKHDSSAFVAYNRLKNLAHAPVLFHDVLERSQEVFLEAEVGELALLNELHGQLSERVDRKEGNVFVRIATHLNFYHTLDVTSATIDDVTRKLYTPC